MFDQLSLAAQFWGYGLLGAIVMALGLFVGAEWPWIRITLATTWTSLRRTFTIRGLRPIVPRRTAGEGCVCDGWHADVFCLRCRSIRRMTPTSTIPASQMTASLASFEERRRREALAIFDGWDGEEAARQ